MFSAETGASATVLALDIGGTHLKGALVDLEGEVLLTERRPTPRGADRALAAVVEFVASLWARADHAWGPVRAAGVAVPGIVDAGAGTVRFSANLGWRDVPLRRVIEAKLGVPTVLIQDARSGALGEATLGVGRSVSSFVYVPIGTGVGGVVIVDGQPVEGATQAAGEIGHVQAVAGGRPCACGRRGCVEAYAGGRGLAEHYAERSGVVLTAERIGQLLGQDAHADAVWGAAVTALAAALAPVVAAMDPDLVVMAGGVASSGRRLIDPLSEALAERIGFRTPPRVVVSALREDAARVGAFVAGRALYRRVCVFDAASGRVAEG